MRFASCPRVLAPLFVLLASTAARTALATITLDPGEISLVYAIAFDDLFDPVTTHSPTSLPDTGAIVATSSPNSSTTSYDVSEFAFTIRFDHARGSGSMAGAFSSALIYFIPSADVAYEITGAYSSDDPEGRETQLYVQLEDLGSGGLGVIYESNQESRASAAESFVVGESGGDHFNQTVGSRTGMLNGGHQYRFFSQADILAYPSEAAETAHATGYATLTFVPEPSTGMLLGAGLAALAIRRRVA